MGWIDIDIEKTLEPDFLEKVFGSKVTDFEIVSVAELSDRNVNHHKQIYGVMESDQGKIGVVGYFRFTGEHASLKLYTENSGPGLVAPSQELLDKLDPPTTQFGKEWREDCESYLDPETRELMEQLRSDQLYSVSELKKLEGSKEMSIEYG